MFYKPNFADSLNGGRVMLSGGKSVGFGGDSWKRNLTVDGITAWTQAIKQDRFARPSQGPMG